MTTVTKWVIRIADAIYRFNHISSQLVGPDDIEIDIQPLQKAVLLYFLRNPGRAICSDELFDNVWNNTAVTNDAISKAVRLTRTSLGDKKGRFSIKTIQSKGWRFEAEILQNPETALELNTQNNGSKMLKEVVSIWPFRSAYDDDSLMANFYCEVSFKEGRFSGSERGDRVGFRLTLRRAELHIATDLANVLRIKPSSVSEKRASVNTDIAVHREGVTPTTAVFRFESIKEKPGLYGAVWADGLNQHLLQVRCPTKDSVLEPPEMEVQIRCKREDMIISDIHYTDSEDRVAWENASAEKRLLVTQYLRDEMIANGLAMGDLGDQFSSFILSDSVTREEHV